MTYYGRLIKIVAATLLVFVAASVTGCSKASEPANQIKKVKVAPAVLTTIGKDTEFAGKLTPVTETVVSAKISGKVKQVNYEVGAAVKVGDILFTLDQAEVEAQYAQAKAAYEGLKGQTQLQIDDAQEYYDKMLELYNAGGAAKQDLDKAESQLTSAKLAWSQVEQAEAAMNLASLQVGNTVVTTPLFGIVAARNVEKGEVISAGIPAFTVIDIKNLLVEVNIPEDLRLTIENGQTVALQVKALGNKEIAGTIKSIGPDADSKTHTYLVRIQVENETQELQPDMLVKAAFPKETRQNVLAVPNEAVLIENDLPYVYIVSEEGTAQKVSVKTGLSDEKMTEITGLKEGDLVMIEGQSFVNDGDKVQIVKS